MVLALTNIHKEKENWFFGNVSFTDSAGKFLTQSGLQYRYINPPLTYPCTAVYQVYHYSFYVINKSQWPPNYELNFTQMYQINELNDYIWMQVQQNEDQIIHLMIFLGLFNCETEGSIHLKEKDLTLKQKQQDHTAQSKIFFLNAQQGNIKLWYSAFISYLWKVHLDTW